MTTTAEKIAVMQAFEEGKKIEYFSRFYDKWVYTSDPIWDWPNCEYRIAVTKPSINWDHVSPEYNWLALGGLGSSTLFKSRPILVGPDWVGSLSPLRCNASSHASLDRGTCDWKDSLVMRPGYEGD